MAYVKIDGHEYYVPDQHKKKTRCTEYAAWTVVYDGREVEVCCECRSGCMWLEDEKHDY